MRRQIILLLAFAAARALKDRAASDGWLPQCEVTFDYASCFPCRSTDASAVLLERCTFVGSLLNETQCTQKLNSTGMPSLATVKATCVLLPSSPVLL